MDKVVIIGSGFAGLSAACCLAQAGKLVTVVEKHAIPGGRARQLSEAGFRFDMGPSWYWMPDIFDRFFARFGKVTGDYYQLQRLSPSYDIYWENGPTHIPADYTALRALFEELEPGSALRLDAFLAGAAEKYRIGMQMAYKPGRSLHEFANREVFRSFLQLDIFTSMARHIARYFSHPQLKQLLSFPVLFLGAMPEKIPALYSLMNYADVKLGTWYPEGGIYSVVKGMHQLATSLGVDFRFEHDVTDIEVVNGRATHVHTNSGSFSADAVVGAADYHFIEQQLLPAAYRSYSERYWNTRVMAPSCLLYYVGLNKKLTALQHHSLFFDVPFDVHAAEIYAKPAWPSAPLFYVSCPSSTDASVAPAGCENLFILIPVAAGLKGDDEALREKYFKIVIRRLEAHLKESLSDAVIYKKCYAGSNFMEDYNAFKGNAYGLANTLSQTAILKPSLRSHKVSNLLYAGQLTVPGPGVPPAIISGELAASEILKILPQKNMAFR